MWSTRGHHEDVLEEPSPPEPAEDGHVPIAPQPITLTEEELNARVQREAQSLHDREVARRNREEQQARRRQMRDDDPVGYVEQEKLDEQNAKLREQQTAQLVTLLGHVGRQHDAVSIDPIVNALPETERQRILSLPEAGQGLPGRKLIVEEALKVYGRQEYTRGYRDAQAKLKKDPVFRKSVLHEFRGNFDEPELYAGEAISDAPPDTVSNRLRNNFYNR